MEEDNLDDARQGEDADGEHEDNLEGAFEDAPEQPGEQGPTEFEFDDFALI